MLKRNLFIILLLLANLSLMAQQTVTGVVKDTGGQPMSGVTVVVKGTSTGTLTGMDGKYSLPVPAGDATLKFSFIGYTDLEVPVGGKTVIDVAMEQAISEISEIVVVGYGTQSRTTVTGAIASVSSKELTSLPVTTLDQALQGRAAGLTVTNNGSPGTAATIRVRGLGTMNSNDPLIVIDGVVSTGLSNLNPTDIESIEVLKDASTTAIYGSLGSHGVIMVSTKKGSPGKTKIDFDSYFGQQWNNKRYDLMNVAQYIQYAGSADVTSPPPVLADAARLGLANTNWQDQIFQKGAMAGYNLAVSSGTENASYRISGGYVKSEGDMIKTGYDRYNIRANGDYKLGIFKIGENVGVSYSSLNPLESSGGRSLIQHAIKMAPYLPVHNTANLGGYQGPHSAYDGQDAENPVRVANLYQDVQKTLDLIGNVYAEAELFKGLRYKSVVGLEDIRLDENAFTPQYVDDNMPGGATHQNPTAIIGKNFSNYISMIYTNSLDYSTTFAERHNLDILGVMEYSTTDRDFTNSSSQNAVTSAIQELTNTSSTLSSATDHYKRIGYLGRLNYNYDQKYIFAASIRKDASSRFGANNRWGTFPSLALGWRLDKEEFMQSISGISTLKLRGSWGKAGNDNIGNYSYASTLTTNEYYVINNVLVTGALPNGPANPDLKWESTTMQNIGLDMALLKNKFTLSAEYFNNKSSDLLMNLNTPASLGIFTGSVAKNVGSVQTKGWEFQVGYNHAEGEFKWSANLNIGTSKNEVLDLGGLKSVDPGVQWQNQPITRLEVGKPMFFFYGWQFNGIFKSNAEAAAYLNGGQLAANGGVGAQGGDYRIVDTNHDGKITADDQTMIGNPFPKMTLGLNLNASFKGFDLSLFIQGSYGNDIYNNTYYDLTGMTRLFNASVDVLKRWQKDGDVTDVPRPSAAGPNVQISSRGVEDGSYTRLKNLTLGYTLPSKLFNGKIAKLRIYVSGQNLLTLTKYTGLDPEVGNYQASGGGAGGLNYIGSGAVTGNGYPVVNFNTGIDYGVYPMPKSFIGGIQLSF